jgi:asparagine synthase (glutamine-hydrolysing)
MLYGSPFRHACTVRIADRRVIERPKMGFPPPLDRWLHHELKPLVDRVLDPKHLAEVGIFNTAMVASVREAHRWRSKDNTQRIWNLVVFEQWRSHWNFQL